MQVARDAVGVFAVEQQFHGVGLVADVLLIELTRQQPLLGFDVIAGARFLLLQIDEARLDRPLFGGQVAQRAVGFGNRPFRIAQSVGRLAARTFGSGETFLHGLDAAAQL